jgi:hypothetical protein
MRRANSVILAVFLAGALVLVHPSGTIFGASAQGAVTSLAVSATPLLDQEGHATRGQYLVVAVLTSANGQPVNNKQVAFFEQVTFMGAVRAVTLGKAMTDSTGTAAVAYQPAQVGSHTLHAKFGGDSQYAASQGETSLQVQAADLVAPFSPQSMPLASVGQWLAKAVELSVLLFWLFLVGLFLWTVLGIRSAGREPATKLVGLGAQAGTE